eukprot:TRINITY_DN21419_c0_g1_i1.p2 TRINITY_DN21419_c0_g1~~TRINITY_DN21419_c0_g1_i1.p2  ORF type:complete len:128 (+),score=8.06 TRINITY_DN21419_c0_g1_i1:327-710(+)
MNTNMNLQTIVDNDEDHKNLLQVVEFMRIIYSTHENKSSGTTIRVPQPSFKAIPYMKVVKYDEVIVKGSKVSLASSLRELIAEQSGVGLHPQTKKHVFSSTMIFALNNEHKIVNDMSATWLGYTKDY